MDNFLKNLGRLFSEGETEIGDDGRNYFRHTKDFEQVEAEASTCLFEGDGSCNEIAIAVLKENGYDVYPGESDSFGWLTGCIEKDGKVLIYG